MKLKFENWRGEQTVSVQKYAYRELDGYMSDGGKLEELSSTIENLLTFNSKLIELLVAKNIVSNTELKDLLDTYEDIEFVND